MPRLDPEVHSYFDEATNAACYIVKDPTSAACAVIDSIWDFDMASGRTHTAHADMLIDEITKNDASGLIGTMKKMIQARKRQQKK